MKRVTLILLVTLPVFVLALPPTSFGGDEMQPVESWQQSAGESGSSCEQSSQPESGNLIERIARAALGMLQPDQAGSEEPIENVHPDDYSPPAAQPDIDDNGWEDQWK